MNISQLENKLKKFDISLTNREICKIIGMAEESYSRKKKLGSDLKQADIEKIENRYGISLLADVVITANNNLVNVLPCCASCGNGITIDSSLIYNYNPSAKYTFVVARGDSMEKTICNSDICIIKNCNEFASDGVYCFSISDDLYIKRVVKNINQIECISDNPVYDKIILKGQEMDKINIIGFVVYIIRSL